ncbi:M23 family metallopeptidase, partial [Sphingopyxis sp. KK2]|uniref:M23 family metallopeptidase n=1 Tax=Sphingopyxis sp. KK2 TaxID=1855727 RepID=UPI0015C30204
MPGRAGTAILAAAPGTVAFAGTAGGYGQMVEIDHGGGLRTRYAHLSHILVSPGEAVSVQQTIALM